MDETYNNDFYQQFQISNRNAVYNRRDYGVTPETSASLINHCMGRYLPSVGILYQKEQNFTDFSYRQTKTLERNNQYDGNEPRGSSNNDKCYVFNSSKDFHEKTMKTRKVRRKERKKRLQMRFTMNQYMFGASVHSGITNGDAHSDDIQQQQSGSEHESEKNTNIGVVSFERCPNSRRIQEVETPLGELCRVGSLVGTSETWTADEPTMPCHFVHPNNFHTQSAPMYNVSKGNGLHESSHALNSLIMVVEKIKNEYDRQHIATSVGRDLLSKESDLTDYMKSFNRFGFSHIIIVGERDFGMLFLDCYGRIFDWDTINFLLWPLGNYLEYELNEPRMAWVVEFNGTITEFEVDFSTCYKQ